MPHRLPLCFECVDAFGRFRLAEVRLKNFGFAPLLGERLKIRSLGAAHWVVTRDQSSGSFSVLEFDTGSILDFSGHDAILGALPFPDCSR